MKSEPPAKHPEEVEGEIVPARRSGISWAWLFPILALLATTWLFWNKWKAQGPEISIAFAEAPGIEPGKTGLIYRGVHAGTVSRVRLDSNLGKVVVSVRLKAFAAGLARSGTDFWIEKPVISLREISGIESIIQGNSINARSRGGGSDESEFEGLAAAPLTPLDASSLVLKLRAESIPFIGRSTPVFHRGVNVGWVRNKTFDAGGKPEIQVIIDEKFASKVRSNSRFWMLSATSVSASRGAVHLEIPALEALLNGGVAFDHFGPEGASVKDGAEFELSPNEIAARAEGPPLSIAFEDSAGLRAGETRICCLGEPVGLVARISMDPVSRRVEVVARLAARFAPLATADSVFTIVRPRLSREGISGLDTLVTGPYIAFEPGSSKELATSFVGRTLPQIDWNNADAGKDGLRIVLRASSLPSLEAGAPVYHRGVIVGRVQEKRIGADGQPELVARIEGKSREALRVNARFWRVPATSVAAGPGVIDVQLQGLSALWQGGVAFEVFDSPGPAATENAGFELHASERLAAAISDPVRITFADGQGLLAGKTEMRYLGIPVGIVERVRTVGGKVEATARFQHGYDFLRRKGSEFAAVRAQLSMQGVHGLEALVSGVYIICVPGGGSGYADSFNAIQTVAPELLNESGFEIVLVSSATRIDAGAEVTYNDTPVGTVVGKTLSKDGKQIQLTARIRAEHRGLVRTSSVFWDAATVEAKLGFLKLQIRTPSVVAPSGRIAFLTPDTGGEPAKKKDVFQLMPRQPSKF